MRDANAFEAALEQYRVEVVRGYNDGSPKTPAEAARDRLRELYFAKHRQWIIELCDRGHYRVKGEYHGQRIGERCELCLVEGRGNLDAAITRAVRDTREKIERAFPEACRFVGFPGEAGHRLLGVLLQLTDADSPTPERLYTEAEVNDACFDCLVYYSLAEEQIDGKDADAVRAMVPDIRAWIRSHKDKSATPAQGDEIMEFKPRSGSANIGTIGAASNPATPDDGGEKIKPPPLRTVVRTEENSPTWVTDYLECGHHVVRNAGNDPCATRRRCGECWINMLAQPSPPPEPPAVLDTETATSDDIRSFVELCRKACKVSSIRYDHAQAQRLLHLASALSRPPDRADDQAWQKMNGHIAKIVGAIMVSLNVTELTIPDQAFIDLPPGASLTRTTSDHAVTFTLRAPHG